MMESIEKLTKEEALAAKKMWSEIFYEDSEQFTEYYFREKMGGNIGYGLKKDGVLCSMLFLTPYTGAVLSPDRAGNTFRQIPLSYIVGVGTGREYRRRGYMNRLLRAALTDLHRAGQPFAFLMPADPAIYTPYQFRYIYDRPVFSILRREDIRAEVMKTQEAEALADFANRELERRAQLFLRRNGSYYRRQQKESRAMNGDVYLWKENGEIAGFYLYAKENGKEEIQEAIVREDFADRGTLCISEEKSPVIMARITNLKEMLSLMRLGQEAQTERIRIRIRLQDPLIREHNGTFLWTVGKKESTIAMLHPGSRPEICTEIGALTEFLFGRQEEDIFCPITQADAQDVYEKLGQIRPLARSWINEIV